MSLSNRDRLRQRLADRLDRQAQDHVPAERLRQDLAQANADVLALLSHLERWDQRWAALRTAVATTLDPEVPVSAAVGAVIRAYLHGDDRLAMHGGCVHAPVFIICCNHRERCMTTLPTTPTQPLGLPPGPASSQEVPDLDQVARYCWLAQTYGGVVRFPLGPMHAVLVTSPSGTNQVLRTQHGTHFGKGDPWKQVGLLIGNGLSANDDDAHHRRQRGLMRRAFSHAAIAQIVADMVPVIDAVLATWQADAAAGTIIDVAERMATLTQTIIVKTLFGTGLDEETTRAVGGALVATLHEIAARQHGADPDDPIPDAIKAAFQLLETVVDRFVAMPPDAAQQNLIQMLLAETDEQGGMSRQQLRDEISVSFLAGYETSALALTWSFYLLATTPNVETALRTEVQTVLGGRAPGIADLPQLTLTRQVLLEAMRLYPPLWLIPRQARQDAVIDGYLVPAGTIVFIGSFMTQRDPTVWGPDALAFRPDRWTPTLLDTLPKGSYTPFGDGPRRCIGEDLAMTEMTLILARFLQRYRLTHDDPTGDVGLDPVFTLRPRGGMPMRIGTAG